MIKGFKGKEAQKLITTLLDLYSGLPRKAIEPTPSTSREKTIQEVPETKLTLTPIEEEKEDSKIGEVVMEVLKSGTQVKRLGKYYEKRQQKV